MGDVVVLVVVSFGRVSYPLLNYVYIYVQTYAYVGTYPTTPTNKTKIQELSATGNSIDRSSLHSVFSLETNKRASKHLHKTSNPLAGTPSVRGEGGKEGAGLQRNICAWRGNEASTNKRTSHNAPTHQRTHEPTNEQPPPPPNDHSHGTIRILEESQSFLSIILGGRPRGTTTSTGSGTKDARWSTVWNIR
jgi:hypothetical protein